MLLFSFAEVIMLMLSSVMFGWAAYNLPALLVGVKQVRRKSAVSGRSEECAVGNLPFFSLIVPMKNEGKVAGRILDSLMKMNYPPDKYEVIVVDDASADETPEICRKFEGQYPSRIRYFHRDVSHGKPEALNYGLKFAKGEIIGVFDADNLPIPDVLIKAAKYFKNRDVVALQGLLSSINAEENLLTRLIHYELMVQHYTVLSGRDKLGLFVPFAGTCQFVRREVLDEVGGWWNGALSEDLDLSARLAEKRYRVKFASDVRSWQENPSKFSQLIGQRIRWFRGVMEVALKYGRLLARLDRRSLDAEVYLAGPFMLVLVFLNYILSFCMIFVPFNLGIYTNVLAQFMSLLSLFTLFVIGVGLAYATRPRKAANLKWLPLIYLYWAVQVFVAFYAFLLIVFRRPRKWVKTPRTGAITNQQLTETLR